MYVVKNSVERLLYALGAGWQGRVNCELQHQSHSPCIGTLSFCPDTTAHQTCAGLRQMKYILFEIFVQTSQLCVCVYLVAMQVYSPLVVLCTTVTW